MMKACMFFIKQQKGSALIAIMIVVCIIALLYFYLGRGNGESGGPVQTVKTYNQATDDIDAVRNNLDKQNNLIKQEASD